MDLEGENSTEMGLDEEMKMEMELDAAHALANLADSDPISNQSSTSQHEGPQQFQPEVRENLKEGKGNRRQNQTLYKAGTSNSNSQAADVSSLRGRKHLNEADRDAKRLRRILANRESARQTIIRRQAFRDELARKISMLSAENLALKQEKENAAREYLSQKEMNEQLKEQMMQITPLKEEKELHPVSEPASQLQVNPSIPANSDSDVAPTVDTQTTTDVSCSLTLGVGKIKDEIAVQKHEAVISKQKLKQLQSDAELKEGSYCLLDAPNARLRRMEISRLKQSNRD